MEHLRLDNQTSPVIGEGLLQEIFHYVYVRGRCSFIELFPLFARREGFQDVVVTLLRSKKLYTDLNSIWAREKQIIFSATPLSMPEENEDRVLSILNNQRHIVGENFTHGGAININRDFQLQWYKINMQPNTSFHLGHFYDSRGRIYPKGHILTYQGTDFQKSLVRCEEYQID